MTSLRPVCPRWLVVFFSLLAVWLAQGWLIGNNDFAQAPLLGPLIFAVAAFSLTLSYPFSRLNIFQVGLAIDFFAFYLLPAISYYVFGYSFYFSLMQGPMTLEMPTALTESTAAFLIAFYGMGFCNRVGGAALKSLPHDQLNEAELGWLNRSVMAASLLLFALLVWFTALGGQSQYRDLRSYSAAIICRFININFLFCLFLTTLPLEPKKIPWARIAVMASCFLATITLTGSRSGLLTLLFAIGFFLALLIKARPAYWEDVQKGRRQYFAAAVFGIPVALLTFIGGTYVRHTQHTAVHNQVNRLPLTKMLQELTQRLSALEYVAFVKTSDSKRNPYLREGLRNEAMEISQQIVTGINTFLPKRLGKIGESRPLLCELFPAIYLNKSVSYVQSYYQCLPLTLLGYLYAKTEVNERYAWLIVGFASFYLVVFSLLCALGLRALYHFKQLRPWLPALYLNSGFILFRLTYFFGWDHFISFLGTTAGGVALSLAVVGFFRAVRIHYPPLRRADKNY